MYLVIYYLVIRTAFSSLVVKLNKNEMLVWPLAGIK